MPIHNKNSQNTRNKMNFLKLTKLIYEKSANTINDDETIKTECFLPNIRNKAKTSALTTYIQHCTK